MKKDVIGFFKPNKWKIILTALWGLLAFIFGYKACASCCPNLAEGELCVAMCCREFSHFFFPYIELSSWMMLIILLWWYSLGCVTYYILKFIIMPKKK